MTAVMLELNVREYRKGSYQGRNEVYFFPTDPSFLPYIWIPDFKIFINLDT